MFMDMGFDLNLSVWTDAEAAKGLATKRGLANSSVRHMAVHYLWVQERVASGDLQLHKINGKLNPADLLTKYLGSEDIRKNMERFGLVTLSGRSPIAPAI